MKRNTIIDPVKAFNAIAEIISRRENLKITVDVKGKNINKKEENCLIA